MKKYFNFRTLLLIASLVAFLLLFSYHLKVISNPYQNELREGAVEMFSDALVNGINVFALENQPQYTNVYGVLYNLILAIIYKIFGSNLIEGRVLSLVFIFASSFLIYKAIRKLKLSKEYAFTGFVIFYASCMELGNTMFVRPDSLGIFLMLSTFIIPWIKDFSWKSLLFSSFFTLLAFFTKPYYIAGMGYLTLYLFLFINRKKAIFYGFLNGLFLGMGLLVIYFLVPLYYNNVIYVNAVSAGNDVQWMLLQFKKFGIYNSFLLIIVSTLSFILIISLIKNKKLSLPNFQLKHFIDLNSPFLFYNTNLFFVMSILISSFIIYWKLGRHTGAFMTYLYQLISPFLIIFAFQLIKKFEDLKYTKIIIPIFLILNFFVIFNFQYKIYNSYDDFSSGWKEVTQIIKSHTNILNSSSITSILLDENKTIYDSGQSQFYYFSKPPKYSSRYNEYLDELKNKVINKEFDVVLLATTYSPLISLDIVNETYSLKKTIPVVMPYSGQTWILGVWEPK